MSPLNSDSVQMEPNAPAFVHCQSYRLLRVYLVAPKGTQRVPGIHFEINVRLCHTGPIPNQPADCPSKPAPIGHNTYQSTGHKGFKPMNETEDTN